MQKPLYVQVKHKGISQFPKGSLSLNPKVTNYIHSIK